VLIGASDLLPGLKERAGTINGEMLTFADADALQALETITKRRPGVVALERMFAVTPRGAALINRIKADPALRDSEIRVLAHDSDYQRVVPRTPPPAAPALDQRGTRRAQRFKMASNVAAQVDGKTATVIDLSTVGAQIISPGKLKPNQKIAVALPDDVTSVRFSASVVWTSFEIPPNSGPRYRAGLDFPDADAEAVGAFCERHKI
jgi:PilZ domain-containing protein